MSIHLTDAVRIVGLPSSDDVSRHAVPVPHHGNAMIQEGALQSIFNGARLPNPRK